MKEDFVGYELAVKLRKKGFNIDTDFCYNQDGGIVRVGTYPAPQIHEVLNWLREEKKIYINISYSRMDKWFYKIYNLKNTGDFMLAADFDIESYEQCAFEGIEYVTDYLI